MINYNVENTFLRAWKIQHMLSLQKPIASRAESYITKQTTFIIVPVTYIHLV